MNIVNKKVADLIPYEKNPRKNDKAVEYVANSIKEFGFKVPIIIDTNNVIVAGHTRLKGAKKLGLEEVPCIVADDLTEEQIKAFRLADNKVSELAEWNNDLLDEELSNIFDLDMKNFGFDIKNENIDSIVDKPEVEFTEVLGEEHNYIVLYFDNDVDWLQMESLLDIGEKKNLSTRKDGKINEKMERKSIGRVFKGKEVLEKLREYYENIG